MGQKENFLGSVLTSQKANVQTLGTTLATSVEIKKIHTTLYCSEATTYIYPNVSSTSKAPLFELYLHFKDKN